MAKPTEPTSTPLVSAPGDDERYPLTVGEYKMLVTTLLDALASTAWTEARSQARAVTARTGELPQRDESRAIIQAAYAKVASTMRNTAMRAHFEEHAEIRMARVFAHGVVDWN